MILFSFSSTLPSNQKKPDDRSPIAVSKTHDFVIWLLPKVERFPRTYRFTVGDRLTPCEHLRLAVFTGTGPPSDS